MVWASGKDAFWMPSRVLDKASWEEIPGQTQDTLEGLYLSAGLGMPWDPPG